VSVASSMVESMKNENASNLSQYPWIERLCPSCHTKGGVRQVIWGLPEAEPIEDLYQMGGCCPEDYKFVCVICNWKGKKLPKLT